MLDVRCQAPVDTVRSQEHTTSGLRRALLASGSSSHRPEALPLLSYQPSGSLCLSLLTLPTPHQHTHTRTPPTAIPGPTLSVDD